MGEAINMKRILFSLAAIVGVAALAVGATGAFFNDTETSEGNIFTAGSIDLKVDHTKQTYNGVDCETCSLELYSADGNTQVVDGSDNATEDSFPFAAPATDPNPAWATHPEADWIWATDPTAVGDDGSNGDVSYTFERTFWWNGLAGDIDFELGVGADNEYEVWLNGVMVDSNTGEDNYSSIATGDFAANLVNGENTLQFVIVNQENDSGANTPSANPGGLLYYLDIERQDCEDGVGGFQEACMLWNEQDLDGSQQFFNFGDIKPGDWGTNVISLHVYDNDAYACLLAHDGDDQENGVRDSEGDDDETEGELQNYITTFSWVDVNGDGMYDTGSDTALGTATLGDLGSIASLEGDEILAATSTEYISLAWCAGDISVDEGTGAIDCDGAGMDNDAQSDSFSASLTAFAEQVRNNEGFSCDDIDLDGEEEDEEEVEGDSGGDV